MGVARLGFITELLSKPIRYGYMNGIALTVLLSQIPKLFGFSVDCEGPLRMRVGNRRQECSLGARMPTGQLAVGAQHARCSYCCSSAGRASLAF